MAMGFCSVQLCAQFTTDLVTYYKVPSLKILADIFNRLSLFDSPEEFSDAFKVTVPILVIKYA